MQSEAKACCAVYENDLVRLLLGDSLHPGGLALTEKIAKGIGLTSSDRVLDMASGPGTSALFLARRFGCEAIGIDLSAKLVASSAQNASRERLNTAFLVAEASSLPFRDGAFSAIVSECSVCTFSNKLRALSEASRVLRPGGRLGLSDPVVDGRLTDLLGEMGRALCLAEALDPIEYRRTLSDVGFREIRIESQVHALLEMLEGIRKRLFLAELLAGIGKLRVENGVLSRAEQVLTEVRKYVDEGALDYVAIIASRC